jgi:hypothetical protein
MSAFPPITGIKHVDTSALCVVGVSVRADPPSSSNDHDRTVEWAPLLFPTDLASFLDLIRQHGDAAYSLMFAYAGSHSLLLALFAGYAAHSGALQLGTLILVCWFGSFAGDAVRFWIGRRQCKTNVRFEANSGHRRYPAGAHCPFNQVLMIVVCFVLSLACETAAFVGHT